jgi:hypothetical protein
MSERSQKFTLILDDNFHFMEADERYTAGEFDSEDAAIHQAKAIIDEFLKAQFTPGMKADDLYSIFCSFGESPFITPECGFSAWAYARKRCDVVCAEFGKAED